MIETIAPYFGYLASLFLVLALIVNSELKFRWFSASGNVAFIAYAIMIMAFPVLITNLILLGINIYYLKKIYSRKEYFDLIEFKGEEQLALRFLEFYKKDITLYFPQFSPEQMKGRLNFVILRNLVIANMFSVDVDANGDAYVILNYTPEKYRDYKVGRFIFEREKQYLLSKGIKRVIYRFEPYKKHRQFLEVMGFKPGTAGDELYVKEL